MIIAPSFEAFLSGYRVGQPQFLHTRLVADLDTPVSIFVALAEGDGYAFLLESVQSGQTRGRYSVIGIAPDLIWQCFGGKAEISRRQNNGANTFAAGALDHPPLESLRALLAEIRTELPKDLPPMAAGMFGYIGYDFVRQIESLGPPPPDPLKLPDATLIRPSLTAIHDNLRDEVILTAPVWPDQAVDPRQAYEQACDRIWATIERMRHRPAAAGCGEIAASTEIHSNTSYDDYLAKIKRAKNYIRAGDIFQVVPSQRFRRGFPLSPLHLYRALRRLNPSPFLYHLTFPNFALVGSSPEILVRLRENKVTIRPIAGTRPRGKTPDEDARLAQELAGDPKERAEHLMLLDLGRNDVGRVSRTGAVNVTDSFFIERYSHVMHLVSNVEGVLRDGLCAVDVLAAGLPAGTLSGAPKIRAMQIIDELEVEKRGACYAGAVGYFSVDGSMDTCIVLRTALLKDGMMYVQAGGGIVADSVPDAEYQETVNKARALFAAADEALRQAKATAAMST